MGLVPAGAKNPFTKIDKQSVIGTLKATGSRDRDILYAQKSELLAPSIIFGWWCWSFGKKNIVTVEAGYTEYLARRQT